MLTIEHKQNAQLGSTPFNGMGIQSGRSLQAQAGGNTRPRPLSAKPVVFGDDGPDHDRNGDHDDDSGAWVPLREQAQEI